MKETLIEFEKQLIKINHPILKKLGDPESKNEVVNLLERNKFKPNDELVRLFLWKNGLVLADYLKKNGDIMELCSFGSFFAIRDLLSYYLLIHSTKPLYNKKYFPFFFSNMGDHILIDLYVKSKTFGKIFIFAPSLTLSAEPMSIFDSLKKMIQTVVSSYKNGFYILKEDGTLEIDFKNEGKVAKELNPGSDFWKDK